MKRSTPSSKESLAWTSTRSEWNPVSEVSSYSQDLSSDSFVDPQINAIRAPSLRALNPIVSREYPFLGLEDSTVWF